MEEDMDMDYYVQLNVYNYLRRINQHEAAELFVKQAGFVPQIFDITDETLAEWKEAYKALKETRNGSPPNPDAGNVIQNGSDAGNMIQNGSPSTLQGPSTTNRLAKKMSQLAITVDDNTGTHSMEEK